MGIEKYKVWAQEYHDSSLLELTRPMFWLLLHLPASASAEQPPCSAPHKVWFKKHIYSFKIHFVYQWALSDQTLVHLLNSYQYQRSWIIASTALLG